MPYARGVLPNSMALAFFDVDDDTAVTVAPIALASRMPICPSPPRPMIPT